MTLILTMMEHVETHPERIAIIDARGRSISYAELEDRSNRLAAAWSAQGLQPGMKVLVAESPSIAFYASMLALWRLGAAAVFPEPFTGLEGLKLAARETNPDAVLASGWVDLILRGVQQTRSIPLRLSPAARSDYLHDITVRSPDDIALLSFTGGSTGRPKCIARSHRFMIEQSKALQPLLASDGHEVDLVWFPVFVFACLAVGATVVLPASDLKRPLEPDRRALLAQVSRHGITRLLAPPAVVLGIARPGEGPWFDAVLTGGGPVFPQDMPALASVGTRAVVVYGSTEAEPISVLDLDDLQAHDLLDMCGGRGILAGYIVEAADVRIVDDEILVAGPHVVEGYVDPSQNEGNKIEIDGRIWHRTGDGGRIDDLGRLWLRGRLKGVVDIRTATDGKHVVVWPFEIEARAREIPGVEGAVLGFIEDEVVLGLVGKDVDGVWAQRIVEIGAHHAVHLSRLPLDKRHGSRIAYDGIEPFLAMHRPVA